MRSGQAAGLGAAAHIQVARARPDPRALQHRLVDPADGSPLDVGPVAGARTPKACRLRRRYGAWVEPT